MNLRVLHRVEVHRVQLKLMTAEECDAIDAKCEQKIKDAKEYAMQSEYADASEYMKYVYVDD